MSETECIHGSRSLSIGVYGDAKICCMSRNTLTSEGRRIRLNTDSIHDAWNSPDRKEIEAALADGIKHPNCESCWQEEAAGMPSKRIRDNLRYKISAEQDQPVIIDLNMGNTCNLKCRTCGSHSSSKWLEEEIEIANVNKYPIQSIMKAYKPFANNFSLDSDAIQILKNWIPKLKFLDFYGGEPMLIKEHWGLLEYSVLTKSSLNQVLHYNSNGTIFPENKLDLFRQFKGLDLSLSIDGYESSFEYLRHPAKWDAIAININKWNDFIKSLNIDVKEITICLTISIMNIFDLDRIYSELKKFNIHIYLNLVHNPHHFSITHIPTKYKEIIYKKLIQSEVFSNKNELQSVLNFMMQSEYKPETWDLFIHKIKTHDEYRQERFANTFPEYYDLISADFIKNQ